MQHWPIEEAVLFVYSWLVYHLASKNMLNYDKYTVHPIRLYTTKIT